MAVPLQRFGLAVRNCNFKHIAPRHVAKSMGRGRDLSTTPQWKSPSVEEIEERISKAAGTSRSAAEYKRALEELDEMGSSEEQNKEDEIEMKARFNARTQPYQLPLRRKRLKQTFMNMGEPEPWEEDGMLDDDHDDITTLAHGELEQHREMRHYARLAAWEMPLLSSMCLPWAGVMGLLKMLADRCLQNWLSHSFHQLRICH
jgi:small subunit ribosomal protein S35